MRRNHPTLRLEERLARGGAPAVLGFDEVGRGALAGPVMVGCTALLAARLQPRGPALPRLLADSKMLTPRERERLVQPLRVLLDAWAVGAATNREIDESGITHALGLAALRALTRCEARLAAGGARDLSGAAGILDGPFDYITPAASAADALRVPFLPTIVTRVRGDATCALASAASVLAKVTRDRLMERLSQRPEYAAYGWARNKGYGTAEHRRALEEVGPSDLHRLTWHLF